MEFKNKSDCTGHQGNLFEVNYCNDDKLMTSYPEWYPDDQDDLSPGLFQAQKGYI